MQGALLPHACSHSDCSPRPFIEQAEWCGLTTRWRRTVVHSGRTVRAFAVSARAGAQWQQRAAAQLDR